jgi:hypothetical protein
MRHHASLTLGFAAMLMFAKPLPPAAAAGPQHHGGGQAHEHGAPARDGAADLEQMVQSLDKAIAGVSSAARDLAATHAGSGNAQDQAVVSSLQGLAEQMRQVYGSMSELTKDPSLAQNAGSAKAFRQACDSLKQMASGFQSLTKHVRRLMPGGS